MISFGNIFAFSGLITLPIIFLLIKYYPPKPKKRVYSSFFLLKNIINRNTIKTNFPLWLLLFRLLICFLIILFFSDPYFKKDQQTENYENYIIISDNAWSKASNWQNYKNIVKEISLEAENNSKKIHLYLASNEDLFDPVIFRSQNEISEYLNKNPPIAKQITRENINEILKMNNFFKTSKVFFIYSNYDSSSKNAQLETLRLIEENNPATIIINPVEKITYLKEVAINNEKVEIKIKRIGIYNNQDLTLEIYDKNEDILFKKKYYFNKNVDEFKLIESFPIETINQFFKITILNESHAGAHYYLDDYRKSLSIGIVAENDSFIEKPLLSPIYYLKKSLDKDHIINFAPIDKLIDNNKSIIFLPSDSKLEKSDIQKLKSWIQSGGTLIKFSDKKIVSQKNLYFDGVAYFQSLREIATDFSLQNNLSIKSFEKDSIFSNLKIPADLIFKKQLIIDGFAPDISILASLEDQSPLITMKNLGVGKVILFHITSNNEWSNLPLSSLFRDIISRLLFIPKLQKYKNSEDLTLKSAINSFGKLAEPLKNYTLRNNFGEIKIYPSSRNPAGIYENENFSIALNLSTNLNTETFLSNSTEKIIIKNNYQKNILKLNSLILSLIFIMFFIDMIISIIMKKNLLQKSMLKNLNLIAFACIIFVICIGQKKIYAEENYNGIYLAYVRSEDPLLNQIANSGLEKLKEYLIERTSISPKGVKEINLATDKLFYYPLIYWQISEIVPRLNNETIEKIKNYFETGGIILFDFINLSKSFYSESETQLEILKSLFSDLGIDSLQQVNKDHTLTRSYYLLDNYPGRFDNKILLIDTENLDKKDGVSSAVVGLNHWIGAWAVDENNYPLYQAVPGGERQRELSFRFGINLIMYALTGNYKSDQIHNKSILKRLKK